MKTFNKSTELVTVVRDFKFDSKKIYIAKINLNYYKLALVENGYSFRPLESTEGGYGTKPTPEEAVGDILECYCHRGTCSEVTVTEYDSFKEFIRETYNKPY